MEDPARPCWRVAEAVHLCTPRQALRSLSTNDQTDMPPERSAVHNPDETSAARISSSQCRRADPAPETVCKLGRLAVRPRPESHHERQDPSPGRGDYL